MQFASSQVMIRNLTSVVKNVSAKDRVLQSRRRPSACRGAGRCGGAAGVRWRAVWRCAAASARRVAGLRAAPSCAALSAGACPAPAASVSARPACLASPPAATVLSSECGLIFRQTHACFCCFWHVCFLVKCTCDDLKIKTPFAQAIETPLQNRT